MDEKMAERFVQRYRQHAKLSQAEAYPFSQRKKCQFKKKNSSADRAVQLLPKLLSANLFLIYLFVNACSLTQARTNYQ